MNPFQIAQLILMAPALMESLSALFEALKRMGGASPETIQKAVRIVDMPKTPEEWMACLECDDGGTAAQT